MLLKLSILFLRLVLKERSGHKKQVLTQLHLVRYRRVRPLNLAYVCTMCSFSSHLRGLNKLFQWVNEPGATKDTPTGEIAMLEPQD